MLSRSRILALFMLVLLVPWYSVAATGKNAGFYFVQITDTHWGPRKHHQRLRKAIEYINKLPMKIDFVVHTGDLASNNLHQDGVVDKNKKLFSQFKAPLYLVAGNHDVMKYNGTSILLKTYQIYTNHFGPLNYTVEHKGVVLVFTFMENERERYTLPGHAPWKWLATTLKKHQQRPVLLFQHAPPTLDLYKSRFETHHQYHDPWGKKNRTRYSTLVNRHGNVKAIVCGHFHRAELHWVGKVPLHVCGSIAGYWGRQGSFRLYHYDQGRLSYQTIYVED